MVNGASSSLCREWGALCLPNKFKPNRLDSKLGFSLTAWASHSRTSARLSFFCYRYAKAPIWLPVRRYVILTILSLILSLRRVLTKNASLENFLHFDESLVSADGLLDEGGVLVVRQGHIVEEVPLPHDGRLQVVLDLGRVLRRTTSAHPVAVDLEPLFTKPLPDDWYQCACHRVDFVRCWPENTDDCGRWRAAVNKDFFVGEGKTKQQQCRTFHWFLESIKTPGTFHRVWKII